MTAIADRICQYLEEQKPNMEKFLRALVALETPSHDAGSQEAILSLLRDKFESEDYSTVYMPGQQTGGYLVAKPRQRIKNQRTQLLIGHCDTVWEKETLLKMPIEKSNGRLSGPGVFDMKAGLTQMVFALQAIRSLDIPLHLTPVCLINSDEEIGSKESTGTIRRLAKIARRAFILEPPLGLDGKLKTARKGLGRFTITVKGKAAHAGLNPGDGVSAILELSHQIQELFSFNDPERGITVNVGMIEGGNSPNVVAPLGKAVADVRAPSLEDAQYITWKINELKPVNPDVQIEVEGGFGRLPMEKTARNDRLWQRAQKEAKKIGVNLKDSTAGGGSDANTTSLFTATLDGLGTTGDGAHALHEFIFLEDMIERTALLTLLLGLPDD